MQTNMDLNQDETIATDDDSGEVDESVYLSRLMLTEYQLSSSPIVVSPGALSEEISPQIGLQCYTKQSRKTFTTEQTNGTMVPPANLVRVQAVLDEEESSPERENSEAKLSASLDSEEAAVETSDQHAEDLRLRKPAAFAAFSFPCLLRYPANISFICSMCVCCVLAPRHTLHLKEREALFQMPRSSCGSCRATLSDGDRLVICALCLGFYPGGCEQRAGIPYVYEVHGHGSRSPEKQGMRILNYLDDWLILAQSETELVSHRTALLSHLEGLGLSVNWTKSSPSPRQSISFLGIELDSVAMTVRLSEQRARRIHHLATSFKVGSQVLLRTFQRILGHMASAAAVLQLGLPRMRRFNAG
ncbi:hypothetical protein PO909_025605 [Leuciscus waleckii]